MRQAIEVLQMPVIELANWLEDQINHNPLLAPIETTFKIPAQEIFQAEETLIEFLTRECVIMFDSDEDKRIGTTLCGFLDHRGFLTSSFEEIAAFCRCSTSQVASIAHQISQLDPPGLAACNISHSLLLQLQHQKKQDSLAYQIIEQDWELLLQKKHSQICKKFNITQNQLNELINKDIRALNPYPASIFQSATSPKVFPDLKIIEVNGELQFSYLGDHLPKLAIQDSYIAMLDDDSFVRPWLASAKWLGHIVNKRKQLLTKLGMFLIENQRLFLLGINSTPAFLSPAVIAEQLEISYTTATRILNNKYIDTPRGQFPLTFFTSTAKLDKNHHIEKVYQILTSCINAEDKKSPLSDVQIAQKMHEKGIQISRRTVAKYRDKLKIPSVISRKIK
ncbi:MAG: hypothetical protein H7A39_03185 [Chlamydiales bacterium]|nr:hypothetical protein [Chlamydiales bacterium]